MERAAARRGVNTTANESASFAGAAYVFVRSAGVWSQNSYQKPAAVGSTQAGGQFGQSVAVSGGTVVIGANLEDSSTTGVNNTVNESAPYAGAIHIFAGFPAPDVAVAQAGPVADGGSVDFGTVTVGGSSSAFTFTVTNPGTANLSRLVLTGGTSEFIVSALSSTGIPVGSGTVTYTVTFTPGGSGLRTATLKLASNVVGAKNPYEIVLHGLGQSIFTTWAAAEGVSNDLTVTGANGLSNLLNFAFGVDPVTGGNGPLHYTGTLSGGGVIAATRQPITLFEPTTFGVDFRAVFVRRKDYVLAGLTYTPQFSANLSMWQNSAVVPTVLADDGTYQIVSGGATFFL